MHRQQRPLLVLAEGASQGQQLDEEAAGGHAVQRGQGGQSSAVTAAADSPSLQLADWPASDKSQLNYEALQPGAGLYCCDPNCSFWQRVALLRSSPGSGGSYPSSFALNCSNQLPAGDPSYLDDEFAASMSTAAAASNNVNNSNLYAHVSLSPVNQAAVSGQFLRSGAVGQVGDGPTTRLAFARRNSSAVIGSMAHPQHSGRLLIGGGQVNSAQQQNNNDHSTPLSKTQTLASFAARQKQQQCSKSPSEYSPAAPSLPSSVTCDAHQWDGSKQQQQQQQQAARLANVLDRQQRERHAADEQIGRRQLDDNMTSGESVVGVGSELSSGDVTDSKRDNEQVYHSSGTRTRTTTAAKSRAVPTNLDCETTATRTSARANRRLKQRRSKRKRPAERATTTDGGLSSESDKSESGSGSEEFVEASAEAGASQSDSQAPECNCSNCQSSRGPSGKPAEESTNNKVPHCERGGGPRQLVQPSDNQSTSTAAAGVVSPHHHHQEPQSRERGARTQIGQLSRNPRHELTAGGVAISVTDTSPDDELPQRPPSLPTSGSSASGESSSLGSLDDNERREQDSETDDNDRSSAFSCPINLIAGQNSAPPTPFPSASQHQQRPSSADTPTPTTTNKNHSLTKTAAPTKGSVNLSKMIETTLSGEPTHQLQLQHQQQQQLTTSSARLALAGHKLRSISGASEARAVSSGSASSVNSAPIGGCGGPLFSGKPTRHHSVNERPQQLFLPTGPGGGFLCKPSSVGTKSSSPLSVGLSGRSGGASFLHPATISGSLLASSPTNFSSSSAPSAPFSSQQQQQHSNSHQPSARRLGSHSPSRFNFGG